MPLKLTNASQIASLNKWADSVDLRLNDHLSTLQKHNTRFVQVAAAQTVFQTDGVNNVVQDLYNLVAGTNITLVAGADGSVKINGATLNSSIPVGTPIIALPSTGPGGGTLSVLNIGTTNSVVMVVSGRGLQCLPKQWALSINVNSASVQVVSMNVAVCTQDTGNVISSTPITFGGNAAPLLSTGVITSDTIALPLSSSVDYFFRLRVSSGGLMNTLVPLSGSLPPCSNNYTASSDLQTANPIVLSGGTPHPGNSLLTSWVAA
jgi:hypothetical protein